MSKKTCGHCGAPMVEYTHSLSKGQARNLYKIAKIGGGPVNPYTDLGMTHSQMCNFRKMRYWGLVDHSNGENRDGYWSMTPAGWDFVKGVTTTHKKVVTYRGEFVRFDGDTVRIQDLTDGWWWSEDYVEHSLPRN